MTNQEAAAPTAASKKRPKFRGFLNYRPSQADKALIRQHVLAPDQLEQVLWSIVDTGHKLSISADHYHKTLQAAVSTLLNESVNAGWVIVFRHNDPLVLLTMVRHVILMNEKDDSWEDMCGREDQNDW